MGIKGLGVYLKKYGKQITFADLANKTVAIDTSIYMYKFKYMSDSFEFINKFKYQIKKFKNNGITPIYIFDGMCPELKQKIKESRKLVKTIEITRDDVTNLKELLDNENIKYCIAPSEGEKFCAYLNFHGYADYVLSNDYDTLLFNCKKLVIYKDQQLTLFDTDLIFEELQINLDQLINAGIASGCDYYSCGVKGLGPKKSIELAKKYPTDFFNQVKAEFDVNTIKKLFTDFTEEEKICDLLMVS